MNLRHWLQSRFFVPLLGLSIVAMSLYGAWHALVGPWTGPRLHLNLFLAWVPYFAALACVALQQRLPQARGLFWACAACWLVFFPNAAYLVTDWRYLPAWQDALWFGIGMLTAFSLCGLMLSTVALYLMHTVLAVRVSPLFGRVAAWGAVMLAGLGVYLGRFVRLNTWDLFTRPGAVFADVAQCFREHPNHLGPIGFSVLFTLLLAGLYYMTLELRHARWSREEVHAWRHTRGGPRRDEFDGEGER